MKKINCHLILHSKAPHLNQIYAGFLDLNKRGFINISKEKKLDTDKQILEVIINNKIKVIYDTMDEEEFFAYTQMQIENIDYYFKRSFKSDIAKNYEFKSYPLGINYNVYSKNGNIFGVKNIIKNKMKKIIKRNKYNFYSEDFENIPIASDSPKICFLTRVWDTEASDIENESVREERKKINDFRVSCISTCERLFKDNFIGGIEDSEFARNNFSQYIVKDKSITKRDKYLDLIKKTDICITTTGLHKSIGWKFGEYIAAGRVVISEPIYYEVPGDFSEGNNYFKFRTVEELTSIIQELLEDKEKRQEVMVNNYRYYNNYVRPETMVLNSLLKIKL